MDPKTSSEIEEKLAKLKREGEERAAQRMAASLSHPYVDLFKTPVAVEALRLISETQAKDAKMATIELKYKKVAVAVADPRLPATKKEIEVLEKNKYEIKVFVASLSGLRQIWTLYKFVKPESEGITGMVHIKKERLEDLARKLTSLKAIEEEIKQIDFSKSGPIVFLEIIIAGALATRASDVHFEAQEDGARIRLRVDGMLHDVFAGLPLKNYGEIIARLKLLGGMKINIRGEAQDGRFTVGMGNKDIEIRASVIPSEFGETVVMRILDPEATTVGLDVLGIREDDMAVVEAEIAKPNGLILNTGPTGSGKTTTLYSFLRKVNNPSIKIITLEDPIEYHLEGIEQTQVDAEAGYTFANGLKAIVRQDPDIILVGEIRDAETADIALQASLTGHLVLSTLHTNNAVGAVPRLINLGAKASTVGPALNLVIAQRLVRRLCPDCKKPAKLTDDMEAKIKKFLDGLPGRVNKENYKDYKVYEPVGCAKCSDLGFKGRVGIFEFLQSGPDLEQLILKDSSEYTLKKLAKEKGMVTMQEDGILTVLSGDTSFKEVENVTGKIEWQG